VREARQVAATRTALLGSAVLLGALLAAPATGATRVRPVCHLITDPRGDTAALATPHVPGSDTDDLLSADLASDGRRVTAVLRVAALQQPDPVAPTGRGYQFTFQVRGLRTTYFLAARTYPTGTSYTYGDFPDDAYVRVLGHGTGTVNPATREVRVSAPVAGFLPKSVRRGSTLVALAAGVYRQWGPELLEDSGSNPVHTANLASGFDRGEGDRYVVGTPSCVRP
jgi:hypothetical protein